MTYNPTISGPWSNSDLYPPDHFAVLRKEQEREAWYLNRQLEAAIREEKENMARRCPEIVTFTQALRASQPDWAESEECEIDLVLVLDALEETGLRLV